MLETRIDEISNSLQYAYRLMNELAIVLHKNEVHEMALTYYKKALLCIKRRFRNKYVAQPETAKIIINIATLYYLQQDYSDALKFYAHALEVLYRVPVHSLDTVVERGKVHMSLANLNRYLNSQVEARNQYYFALEQFEQCQERKDDYVESEGVFPALQSIKISQLMLEARHALKQLENTSSGVFSYTPYKPERQ